MLKYFLIPKFLILTTKIASKWKNVNLAWSEIGFDPLSIQLNGRFVSVGADEITARRFEIGHDDEQLSFESQIVANQRFVFQLDGGDFFGHFHLPFGLAVILSPLVE